MPRGPTDSLLSISILAEAAVDQKRTQICTPCQAIFKGLRVLALLTLQLRNFSKQRIRQAGQLRLSKISNSFTLRFSFAKLRLMLPKRKIQAWRKTVMLRGLRKKMNRRYYPKIKCRKSLSPRNAVASQSHIMKIKQSRN
jgi:hypothetical protein